MYRMFWMDKRQTEAVFDAMGGEDAEHQVLWAVGGGRRRKVRKHMNSSCLPQPLHPFPRGLNLI